MNSVATQGVLVATGLQDKFSWKSVAASAVGAAIGNQIGNSLGETDWGKANPRAANVVGGVSSGLAAAAVRHGITGDDIDYSQVAAESFAHGIGRIIANELNQPQEAETS